MRNKLSNRISFQGSKAQCKKVLSQKVIFAWILKCTTDEFSVFSIEEVMKCIGDEPEAGKEIVQKLMEMGMKPEWIAEGTTLLIEVIKEIAFPIPQKNII